MENINDKLQMSNICILLIGFSVPDEVMNDICSKDRVPPIQTHKLAWNIIHGLEANIDDPLDLISSLPITDYPDNPKIFVSHKVWERKNGGSIVMLSFLNILLLKHLTRFISCLRLAFAWEIRNRKSKFKAILLHGVHSPHMYAGIILSKIARIPIVCIVTDPPGIVSSRDNKLGVLAKRIDKAILSYGLRRMSGLVVLTEQIASHFAPAQKFIVMEGIACEPDGFHDHAFPDRDCRERPEGEFVIMYAGGLSEAYGVRLLIDAFGMLEYANFRLWLFGKGDLEQYAKDAAAKDSRVIYWGFKDNRFVMNKEREATVLINPRPSGQDFTNFSFPSKILEYMLSGNPVVTTRLPGLPEEYFPYLELIRDETAFGIAQVLTNLYGRPRSELYRIGNNARNYVINRKNPIQQGNRILDFIKTMF